MKELKETPLKGALYHMIANGKCIHTLRKSVLKLCISKIPLTNILTNHLMILAKRDFVLI